MTDLLHTPPLAAVLDRVERADVLDQVVVPVEHVVRRVPEGVRRQLHGVGWIGHPLHPALVHLPLGSWMAASVMDVAGQEDAAKSLTVLGVVAALPAVVAGWSDWAGLSDGQKRTGVVHAAANSVGLVFYLGSIAARAKGRGRLGRKLGLAGLAAVSLGGAIGGDLAFRQMAGSDLVKKG